MTSPSAENEAAPKASALTFFACYLTDSFFYTLFPTVGLLIATRPRHGMDSLKVDSLVLDIRITSALNPSTRKWSLCSDAKLVENQIEVVFDSDSDSDDDDEADDVVGAPRRLAAANMAPITPRVALHSHTRRASSAVNKKQAPGGGFFSKPVEASANNDSDFSVQLFEVRRRLPNASRFGHPARVPRCEADAPSPPASPFSLAQESSSCADLSEAVQPPIEGFVIVSSTPAQRRAATFEPPFCDPSPRGTGVRMGGRVGPAGLVAPTSTCTHNDSSGLDVRLTPRSHNGRACVCVLGGRGGGGWAPGPPAGGR